MRERLESLAREMRGAYDTLRQKALHARSSKTLQVHRVESIPLTLSVAAVDGGLLSARMHGADIVVARAVGVIFNYRDSKLETHIYHPSKSPPADIGMKSSLEEHEALVFRSLIRLKHELSCAISLIQSSRPDVMLMDGSLLPLPSDRPSEGSPLRPLYDEVLGLFRSLHSISKDSGCLLCGVIKDSRSKRLSRKMGAECPDTLFCGYLLEDGERTEAMPYSGENAQNPDAASLGGCISVFYIRPSKSDLPLRIEVLGADIGRASSILMGLSCISENFAYPAALIEADMCAALDPGELESIEASLASLSGMRPLRRNSRPFR